MLSSIGKVYFQVVSVIRNRKDEIPTIYLNILNSQTGEMLGQMRFNEDPNYLKGYIRMAFNVRDSELINPSSQEKCDLLEEIVVGGLIWISMDNHYFVPKGVLPYMVVHSYPEDNSLMDMINLKIINILSDYGCNREAKDGWVFSPSKGNFKISEFLRSKQKRRKK